MAASPGIAPHWERGQAAVLRYVTRTGEPGMSWPALVAEDRDDLLALYIPAGARYRRWGALNGHRALVEAEWRRDTLRLMYPGEPYSIWLSWDGSGAGRSFHGYYINLEEPFRRTPLGFDTNDHTLDIVVAPDLTWRWKDEEEFEERLRTGIYSRDFGHEARETAARVLRLLEERASPFGDGWEHWSPEPSWPRPTLLDGWDTTPAVLWERRHWAYGDARR